VLKIDDLCQLVQVLSVGLRAGDTWTYNLASLKTCLSQISITPSRQSYLEYKIFYPWFSVVNCPVLFLCFQNFTINFLSPSVTIIFILRVLSSFNMIKCFCVCDFYDLVIIVCMILVFSVMIV